MIEVGLTSVCSDIAEELRNLSEEVQDKIVRDAAINVMAEIKVRVHQQGKASDESQIGVYSDSYLKYRSGTYSDSKTNKKGAVTSAGRYSKGANIGKKRRKFNRGTDSRVILSLTRQMESDMQVQKIEGGYAIGYSNRKNLDKALWNQIRYKKAIWALSIKEKEIVKSIAQSYVENSIK
jgi:hypothetical protein